MVNIVLKKIIVKKKKIEKKNVWKKIVKKNKCGKKIIYNWGKTNSLNKMRGHTTL